MKGRDPFTKTQVETQNAILRSASHPSLGNEVSRGFPAFQQPAELQAPHMGSPIAFLITSSKASPMALPTPHGIAHCIPLSHPSWHRISYHTPHGITHCTAHPHPSLHPPWHHSSHFSSYPTGWVWCHNQVCG